VLGHAVLPRDRGAMSLDLDRVQLDARLGEYAFEPVVKILEDALYWLSSQSVLSMMRKMWAPLPLVLTSM